MPTLTKRQKRSSRQRSEARHPHRSVKALREERLEAYRSMQKVRKQLDESEDGRLSGEQRQEWERATKAFNTLSRDLNMAEQLRNARRAIEQVDDDPTGDYGDERRSRRDARREDRNQPKITHETRNLALKAWFLTRSGLGEKVTRDHRRACKAVGLNRHSEHLEIKMYRSDEVKQLQQEYQRVHPAAAAAHARAFSINNPADGAVFTSPTMVNGMEAALMNYSGIMQVAEVIVTDTGNDMPWPTINDTGNKGRRIGAAKKATTAKTDIAKNLVWKAHKYTSDGMQIEEEALEDYGFDIASRIPNLGAERIARIFNDEATTGSGANEPDGLNNAYVGYTTATSGTLVPDDVRKFVGKLDPAYTQGAKIMMAPNIMTEIGLLKDGQGNFIWQPGFQLGLPDRLCGYPVVPNVSMDSTIAANKLVMAFGDLKYIKVRRVRSMRIYRERDNETDTEKFFIYVRMDSKVLDAGTHPIMLMKIKP